MIEQETDTVEPVASVQRPTPMNSLVAAAQRITRKTIERRDKRQTTLAQQWQEDAWDMYDLVGEQRFLADTLSNRLGQARLYVGKLNTDDPTAAPEPVTEGKPADAWSFFAGGSSAKVAQLISRLGVNLFVAGDGWLVGIPRELLDQTRTDQPDLEDELVEDDEPLNIVPIIPGDDNTDMGSLEWRMLSVSEVTFNREGTVTITMGEGKDEKITSSPDDIFLIRVWRPHPRRWWQANSPTKASLPVLRELVSLTMDVSAQVDSRLAGAGILLVPQSASDAVRRQSQQDEDDDSDPFTESLIEAMTTPINDRSSAAAVVPLVLTVPDETVEKFKHISFAGELSAEAMQLREEAIRRLALGQDAPPEILLGVADMNHWGAWLVREDTVITHIEPPLALVCDALTSQFLHPVLVDQGMSEEEASQYVIWYDVDHLIMRPNRSSDAAQLHAAGVISDEAYRDAAGFDESDAPKGATLDVAVSTALDMVRAAPSLAQQPGLPALVDQLRAVIEGKPAPEAPAAPQPPAPSTPPAEDDQSQDDQPSGASEEGPPNTSEDDAPDIAASAVPVFVRDGQVTRPVMIPVSHGGE